MFNVRSLGFHQLRDGSHPRSKSGSLRYVLGVSVALDGDRRCGTVNVGLFTEPIVDFSGRFDRIDRAALVPKPTGPIPIWLGGSGDRAYERAARLADGFMFIGPGVERTIETWNALRDRVTNAGRSADEFGGDYVALSGANIVELTAEIDAWRDAGGTHVSVVTMGLGLATTDEHIDYITSLADALKLS
jgi:alkanesulfonate monooxygenase SsuD/methylene tetrahydromethanopterin reductase-like flavin-dependent oxidoreductase (luciferase family)